MRLKRRWIVVERVEDAYPSSLRITRVVARARTINSALIVQKTLPHTDAWIVDEEGWQAIKSAGWIEVEGNP